MAKSFILMVIIGSLVVGGCANQQKFLDSKQPMAMETGVNKGKFELNCPEAQGVLISREVVQPALQGPFMNGIQRAEFTIGVEGCGKRQTYIIICPDGGEGCFATGPGRFHDWQR